MRRTITIVGLLAVLGIAAFLYLFKREAVGEIIDSARGYPRAETPQECVDNFKKTVKERRYDKAAKYCTKDYAEQLTRGAEAATALGQAIDDLAHRMNNDGVMTSEIEAILFLNDPLPELTLTVQKSGDTEATADIGVSKQIALADVTKNWKIDLGFIQAFYHDYKLKYVKLVKEGDYWKIDIPVTPDMRNRVDRMIQCHMDYVNALKKMSEEVRTERTTKLEVAKRLEELLSEAVTAPK
jgi:hypothetical protein